MLRKNCKLNCLKNLSSILLIFTLFIACEHSSSELDWPGINQQTRPWTRWWWMGNAVNKEELSDVMEEYKEAGLGGVEITPIYGVEGYEDKFITYLFRGWWPCH